MPGYTLLINYSDPVYWVRVNYDINYIYRHVQPLTTLLAVNFRRALKKPFRPEHAILAVMASTSSEGSDKPALTRRHTRTIASHMHKVW